MFAPGTTSILVDNPDAAPDEQNSLILRTRLGLDRHGAMWAMYNAARSQAEAVGAPLGIDQVRLIYLLHYLQSWHGPAFTGEDGAPIPLHADLIGALDPAIDLVQRALVEAERLMVAQYARPDVVPKRPKAHAATATGKRSSRRGVTTSVTPKTRARKSATGTPKS